MCFRIEMRSKIEVNTDPQRRCYDGVHFSSEIIWTEWDLLESCWANIDIAENRIQYWKSLNEYAVKERGEIARMEFRIVEES